MVVGLIVRAIVRQDEGDVDRAVVRLESEIVGRVLSRAHVFYSM